MDTQGHHEATIFSLRSMYNKTIIRFGCCDIQNNQGLFKVISISLRLRLITPTSNLILLNIIKTSSNDRSVISLSENIGVFHVNLDVGFGDVM